MIMTFTSLRLRATAVIAVSLAAVTALAVLVALPSLYGTAPAHDRLRTAASLRGAGAMDAAISDAQAAVDEAPEDAEALVRLGASLLDKARLTADPSLYERADTSFGRALELEPDHPTALIGTATLALARHDFAGALAIGERILDLAPEIVTTDGIVGDALVELGRYEEALAVVQRMVDARPDLSSYSRVAYLRELHGDLEGAIQAMEMAVVARGPSLENTEYVRVQLGNLQLANGRADLAEHLYRTSLDRLQDYVPALGGLARVAIAHGDPDEAIRLLDEATRRQPVPELVVLLGETLEARGRMDEARVQYGLAEAMQRLHEANGVAVDLELAAFMTDHGDPDTALELARRAFEERPTVHAADTLAWALHGAGDDAAADRFAREALRLGTRDPRILYHAGTIADALGDRDRAADLLATALEGNPHFHPLDAPRAEALLDRLVAAP